MKAELIHDMTNEELATKLNELKEELFNLRFSHATKQLDNTGNLVSVKRNIARVKTVMRERELGIKREVKNKK